jgi:hypothetical protein
MTATSAADFWSHYREVLREALSKPGAWENYKRDLTWTPIAIGAAEKVCKERLGLVTEKEYYRVDLIGYDTRGTGDWFLRVAYEHENRDSWPTEFCKLTHVAADLCVLCSYYDFRKAKPLEAVLQAHVDRLMDRVKRILDRQWLFVFGPRCICADADHPFVAFTLTPEWRVARLPDAQPLVIEPAR